MGNEPILLTPTKPQYPERCIPLNADEAVVISELTFNNGALWLFFVNSSGQEYGYSLTPYSGEKLPVYLRHSNISYNGFYFKFGAYGTPSETHSVELSFDKINKDKALANITYVKIPRA